MSCQICNSPETGRCPGLSIMFECESWTDELGQFRPGKLCARENEVEPENGGGEVNKHTPGPWIAHGLAIYTKDKRPHWITPLDPRESLIAEVRDYETSDENSVFDNAPSLSEAEANARLIASAPTMLAALERVAEWFKRHGTAETQGIACDVFQAIDAAKGNP